MKLNGKVALVTGASRGIGAAIASKLASLGCDVAINYAGNIQKAEETLNKKIATGEVEIFIEKIEILGKCKNILPFEINTDQEVREDLRLEYRFLDLRNEKLHNNILLRSKILKTLK